MSCGARVFAACTTAVVLILGGALPSARADTCPNAASRSGPSERLPDCRAFEQVSPVEKNGLDAVTLEPMQSAQSSACEPAESCTIAYMNDGASFAGAQGNDFANAYLASRGTSGWPTTPLSPPTPQAPPDGMSFVTYAFSEDLSRVVLRVPLQQLTEGAPPGVFNLYLRSPSGAYSLVTASTPPELPPSGCGLCFEEIDRPAFAGASEDFSHVLFEANDGLQGAPSGTITNFLGEEREIENLYETTAGEVHDVGVLPDGSLAPHGEGLGGGIDVVGEQANELAHAVSSDGSHVLFTAEADGGAPDAQQLGYPELYDRIEGSSTVELSAPTPGAQPGDCETEGGFCNPEPAEFWAASADGSAVYFTSRAALTKDAFTGPEESPAARRAQEEETGERVENQGEDLYRYDLRSGRLTDLTADAHNAEDPDGANVLGVVGASEDGSHVYFVAAGHLGENPPHGQPEPLPNLYVWHETGEGAGMITYIATLAPPSEGEQRNIEHERTGPGFKYRSDVLDWSSDPRAAQAYVTPDGLHLAFMSVAPLTGYDNEQAGGELAHEVFKYSVGGGPPVCVSCDPSGAAPLGSAFLGSGLSERASTPWHQPRSLSDDGTRLFFTSPDPLVQGLAGGAEKVFEYEDGAAQLISGAQGGAKDVFLDASASGNDVFFATREALTPSDGDELIDVYDARVDGGLTAPSIPSGCEAPSCASASTGLSLPTLASESFVGPAGAASPPPKRKPSAKQLLARALASCGKLRSRRRRAACRASAYRRFAPKERKAPTTVSERHPARR